VPRVAAALALLTSVAYGVANYLGPRLARDAPYLLLLFVGQGCSLLLSAVVVAAVAAGPPDAAALAWAALAGVGNAIGLILFYEAAEIGPLSIITPIGSIGIAVPVAVGLSSGESVSAAQMAGILLAVTGLVLVARRPGTPVAPVPGEPLPAHPADQNAARRRAVVLSLLAAAAFGVFLAAIKPASEESAPWAVAVSRFGVVAIVGAMALRAGALMPGRTATRLGLLAIPGVLLFAGTLSYAAATREGDLTVVSVLGSLFTIVTVSLAVTLDGERLTRIAWAGVAAAITGVILLSAQ
jgi:drug/metabolite transporter (DMT)-like permease